jgi:hypothetical protein
MLSSTSGTSFLVSLIRPDWCLKIKQVRLDVRTCFPQSYFSPLNPEPDIACGHCAIKFSCCPCRDAMFSVVHMNLGALISQSENTVIDIVRGHKLWTLNDLYYIYLRRMFHFKMVWFVVVFLLLLLLLLFRPRRVMTVKR